MMLVNPAAFLPEAESKQQARVHRSTSIHARTHLDLVEERELDAVALLHVLAYLCEFNMRPLDQPTVSFDCIIDPKPKSNRRILTFSICVDQRVYGWMRELKQG